MALDITPATAGPAGTPTPGTPEYDAAMAALGGGSAAAPSAKPDWLAEKFWDANTGAPNVEALAKSYAELERAQSGKPAAAPAAPTVTDGLQIAAPTVDLTADYEKYKAEVLTTGALSEASKSALKKAGVADMFIDALVQSQVSAREKSNNEAIAVVGGQAQWDAVKTWAATNLPAEDLGRFNVAVKQSKESAMIAMGWLNDKFKAANGSAPVLAQGGPAPNGSSGFHSQAEMVAAMSDPKYKADKAYRAWVAQQVARRTY